MNPVIRKLVLGYSVRNRRRKADQLQRLMESRGLATVLLVGVAGESDQVNEDIVERAVSTHGQVVAAVSPVAVITPWPLVVGDGCRLPFRDSSVDLVLSNAVIEHVGGEAEQLAFVAEHLRVGRAWFMTTPNRWFPVESHTSVLFKHWSRTWSAERDEFTRLLSRREFVALLPAGATVRGHWWSPTFSAWGPRD